MRTVSSIYLLIAFVITGCGHDTAPAPGSRLTDPPKPPPAVPIAQAMPMDAALQTEARQIILASLHSSDEVVRAHALEVIKDLNQPDAPALIITALDDPSPLVRKAAALAAGELQVAAAEERINQHLELAKTPERLADMFALHRLGDTSHSHEFEQTANDTDPHIRGDTALILGMIGNKSAIPILIHMMKSDRSPAVNLQAAEALWKLGDEQGLDDLVGATISRYPDDQMIALIALAEPHDTRVLGHVQGLLTEQLPEVSLVAARAAGMLGSDEGYGIAVNGAKSPDPRRRLLAALAFGAIGRSDSQPILAKLLTDEDADTRLAAAGAIMQIARKG